MTIVFPPPLAPVDEMNRLPGVTRAKGLIGGLIRQMTLDAVRGGRRLPPRPLLRRPDPSPAWGRARFVGVHVDDYLTHGNAVHLVTSRTADGLPASVMWLPAMEVGVADQRRYGGALTYWWAGRELPLEDVVHVARGADPRNPVRGMGVVEQHVTTWTKLSKRETYETDAVSTSGVPSVVVTTPNPDLSQTEADTMKASWMEKFARREPVILPSGVEVKPLAWSPNDSQMAEAHNMGLVDIANAFGMDGSWVGASVEGMTYKNISSMFLGLVRETIEPISDDFEQIWGDSWLSWGQELQFRKSDILTGDLTSEMGWIGDAIDRKLITEDEGRARLSYPPMTREDSSV